ncbi:MAG: Uncharacterized protein FD135_3725 [Comamonadaceae bacterium]|nr:MAG: Uncharacterized protein FD135_3725 [Comamonadaceae bacterium]
MSFDLQLISSLVGVGVSAICAVAAWFLKGILVKSKNRNRDKIHEAARNYLAQIRFNVGGVGIQYSIEKLLPRIQVANQLLVDVEHGIAAEVSEHEELSEIQLKLELDERITEVRERLESIEKRLPSDATIDKISSINDALFAQLIEQLSTRLDKLEDKLLTKWDVAQIVSVVVAGIFTVVGTTYAVLKVFSHVPIT